MGELGLEQGGDQFRIELGILEGEGRALRIAFGAREQFRLTRPDGGVMHAELKIGDSIIMMGTPMGEAKA